jgi:branched-chain amino acid transport system substrate-binding protein
VGLRRIAAAGLMVIGSVSFAQTGQPLRIGVLTDMGSAYSDLGGKYSVAAAQMAIDDFGGTVLGRKIELMSADHQNKPAVGSSVAAEWFDRENVSAIFGLAGSSVALAVQAMLKDRPSRVIVHTTSQTSDLTGKNCVANGIHWVTDFYPLSVPTTRYVSQKLAKSWYVLVQDTAAGAPARAAAVAGIQQGGGRVVGDARVPVNAGDVSSFVLQAQGSKAQAIAIGFAGSDVANVIKAARQFGLQQSGVSLVMSGGLFASDVTGTGLDLAGGIISSAPFYPEMNAEARAWSKRFQDKTGKIPSYTHVGDYEAVMHYLKAIQQAGTDDARKVVPQMKSTPVNSFALKDGRIRENNHLIRPIYLLRIKTTAQSRAPSDYAELLATVPGEEAYSPIAQSECSLGKK